MSPTVWYCIHSSIGLCQSLAQHCKMSTLPLNLVHVAYYIIFHFWKIIGMWNNYKPTGLNLGYAG